MSYEMSNSTDYDLLEAAIKNCCERHTTSRGAHVNPRFRNYVRKGDSVSFDLLFETAPIDAALGPLSRPFTKGEMNSFAYALKSQGCIWEAARIALERAIQGLAGGRTSP